MSQQPSPADVSTARRVRADQDRQPGGQGPSGHTLSTRAAITGALHPIPPLIRQGLTFQTYPPRVSRLVVNTP